MSITRKKVAILGAGITGLTAAYTLQKKSSEPLDITLYESKSSIGGCIQTKKVQNALFEMGPHTLRLVEPYKTFCLNLFEELGLKDQMLFCPKGLKRFMTSVNGLEAIPSHPFHLFKKKPFKTLLKPLVKEFISSKKNCVNDPSIETFFNKRYGALFTQNWIDPMVTGIFGGDIKKLSMQACFPQLFELRESRSLIFEMLKKSRKDPSLIFTFKEGLSQLCNALLQEADVNLKLNTPIEKMDLKPTLTLHTLKEKKNYDAVLFCLPTYQLPSLLNQPLHFSTPTFLSYKVIHLGFESPLDICPAYGFLSPSWLSEGINGVLFDSFICPQHDSSSLKFRLTIFISERSKYFHLDSKTLLDLVKQDLKRLLKVSIHPIYESATELLKVLPQYEIGHLDHIQQLKDDLKNENPLFFMAGKSFEGSSVPACMKQGAQMAEEVLEKLNGLSTHLIRR